MERVEYETLAAVEGSHWWFGGMRAVTAALLDPLYAGRRDLAVLDAGCGTGGNGQFLHRYGRVVGIDLAAVALEFARARLAGALARGSVLALPFRSACFDLVTSFEVIYHRAVPDEHVALREMARVLRPNGRLLVRLPAFDFLRGHHDRAVHTRRRYRAAELRAMLHATGFVVERLTYVNCLLFPIPLVQRALERAAPPDERSGSDLARTGGLANHLLRLPLACEAGWIAAGGTFPYGLSVLALARKCAAPGES